MKKASWLIFCFVLLWPLPAHAASDGDLRPYHFAVVMPAILAESFEDSSEPFEGVAFPLFCGVLSVYPKDNRIMFTKTTKLPIRWIEKILRQLEKDRAFSIGHPSANVVVRLTDEDFPLVIKSWAESNWFNLFSINSGDTIPLNIPPLFKRTCPYNSRKKPPVDCGYHPALIEEIRIPYAWEAEARKSLEQWYKDKQKK